MDMSALEQAWREYIERATRQPYASDVQYGYIEPTRASWVAGYAAGAGYGLDLVKQAVARLEHRAKGGS